MRLLFVAVSVIFLPSQVAMKKGKSQNKAIPSDPLNQAVLDMQDKLMNRAVLTYSSELKQTADYFLELEDKSGIYPTGGKNADGLVVVEFNVTKPIKKLKKKFEKWWEKYLQKLGDQIFYGCSQALLESQNGRNSSKFCCWFAVL